jgi:hypothetical protein
MAGLMGMSQGPVFEKVEKRELRGDRIRLFRMTRYRSGLEELARSRDHEVARTAAVTLRTFVAGM